MVPHVHNSVDSEKKIIVVLGATGSQGGALVKAILEDASGPFTVRAVTRDVNSAKAQALAKMGADVVTASLDDPTSIDAALQGAYGAFFVTFFWEHMSPEKETEHVHTLAKAAKAADLKHVIWSTLEDSRAWIPLSDDRMPTLHEKYKVPHFDSKAEGDRFFKDLAVPTTFLITSFYWDNFINWTVMGPQRENDGKLILSLPISDKKLAGIAVEDIGRCSYSIFKAGPQYIGQTLGVASSYLTGEQIAAAFAATLKEEVTYAPISFDMFRSLDFPGAIELGNMFQLMAEFEEDICKVRDISQSQQLHPQLKSLGEFLAENKERISL